MKRLAQRFRNVAPLTCMALALVFAGCADAPTEPEPQDSAIAKPTLALQSDGLRCTEAGATLSSGAPFRVCAPPNIWNRDLVVFVPGYRDPASAPELIDDFAESPISLLFTTLGYGFATTAFRGTGLIEPDTWIGEDLLELVDTARTLLFQATGRSARFVYQTGGSQGGLATVKAVEEYPEVFSGGLAACGPIGDYRRQIDYLADFRLVFDYFFAGVIPAWPVWRQNLSAGDPGYVDPNQWAAAEPLVGTALDDPSNADRTRQVLGVTRAPVESSDPGSVKATTVGILWYSFRGSNDAIAKLGGMPFGNGDHRYGGSSDDAALNAGIERFEFTADASRIADLETSAQLQRPLVTMHTTGDPIIPAWHQASYRERLSFLDKWLLHTPLTVDRYGHCNFTDAELLAAFAVLVLKVTGHNLLVAGGLLPDAQARARFLELARGHGAEPVVSR